MTDMKRAWKYRLAGAVRQRLPGVVTGRLGPWLRKKIPYERKTVVFHEGFTPSPGF